MVALKREEEKKNGCYLWTCKCDCGNVVLVPSGYLPRKKSCGCLVSETASRTASTGNNRRTHGMKGTKIYHVWEVIKYRCLNENNSQWKNYGGRGITICDEWKNDFKTFYDYVSELPHYGEEGYSIDRIDNDGNYEPGNCKWSTRLEQNTNKRNNIKVEYNGECRTLKEWSRDLGINYETLRNRYKANKPVEELFSKKRLKRRKYEQ
mgnify:CR=1 FL=1